MNVNLSRLTLLFIIFIDAVGLGVVYPTMAYYFLDPTSSMFNPAISEKTRLLYLGMVFATYPFFMAIGSLKIGKLSDEFGRKKAFQLCLIGFCLGFLFLIIGMQLHALWLIILGRAIAGLTAGSHIIAQASMADVSVDSLDKAKNMSAVVMANTLGFVIGPVIGGLLSSDISPFFTIYSPFIATVILGIIALILLQLFFKETFVATNTVENVPGSIIPLKLFKNNIVIYLSLIYFLFTLGWNLFFQFAPIYLQNVFSASAETTGLFMSFVALIFMLSIAIVVRPFIVRLGLHRSLCIGLLLLIFSIFTCLSLSLFHLFWIVTIPLCIGGGFVYTASISLYSDAAHAQQQGHMMGIASVVKSVAWTLAPIISGVIASIYMQLPLHVAGICFVIALSLAFVLQHCFLKANTSLEAQTK